MINLESSPNSITYESDRLFEVEFRYVRTCASSPETTWTPSPEDTTEQSRYVRMCVRTYVCTYMCVYVCMHVCVRASMDVCMYVLKYVWQSECNYLLLFVFCVLCFAIAFLNDLILLRNLILFDEHIFFLFLALIYLVITFILTHLFSNKFAFLLLCWRMNYLFTIKLFTNSFSHFFTYRFIKVCIN